MRTLPNVGVLTRFDPPASGASTRVLVLLSGLVDGRAEIGGTVGYTTNIGAAPNGGVKWSDSADAAAPASYGTATTAANFSASDGGTLYLHLTHDGTTYTRSAPVRQVPPAFSVQPAFAR